MVKSRKSFFQSSLTVRRHCWPVTSSVRSFKDKLQASRLPTVLVSYGDINVEEMLGKSRVGKMFSQMVSVAHSVPGHPDHKFGTARNKS